MKVSFKKVGERTYSSVVVRDDGMVLSVPGHDRPKVLPHDIVHLIVERALNLPSGFWGKVARGAIFGGMEVVEGRQRPHADTRSKLAMKDDEQLATQAEVLVAALFEIASRKIDHNWRESRAILADAWHPPGVAEIEWNPTIVSGICDEIRTATSEWQNLAIGGTMEFEFGLRDLEKRRKR